MGATILQVVYRQDGVPEFFLCVAEPKYSAGHREDDQRA